MVFSELASEDGINNELLDFEDIAMRFNGMGHPEVLTRRMTTKQALQLFLDSFVGGTEVDGKVTLNEFVNYYTNVGAAIDNDNYFDLLVRNVWGVADNNNDNSNGKGYSESKERDNRNKSLRTGKGGDNNGGVKSNASIASSVSGSKQTPHLSGSAWAAGQQGLGQQQPQQQRQRPLSAATTRIQRPMSGIASSSSSAYPPPNLSSSSQQQQPSTSVPVRPASAYNTRPTNSNNNHPLMFTQPKPAPTPPIKVTTTPLTLINTPSQNISRILFWISILLRQIHPLSDNLSTHPINPLSNNLSTTLSTHSLTTYQPPYQHLTHPTNHPSRPSHTPYQPTLSTPTLSTPTLSTPTLSTTPSRPSHTPY